MSTWVEKVKKWGNMELRPDGTGFAMALADLEARIETLEWHVDRTNDALRTPVDRLRQNNDKAVK